MGGPSSFVDPAPACKSRHPAHVHQPTKEDFFLATTIRTLPSAPPGGPLQKILGVRGWGSRGVATPGCRPRIVGGEDRAPFRWYARNDVDERGQPTSLLKPCCAQRLRRRRCIRGFLPASRWRPSKELDTVVEHDAVAAPGEAVGEDDGSLGAGRHAGEVDLGPYERWPTERSMTGCGSPASLCGSQRGHFWAW